jgi:hypothetical protein
MTVAITSAITYHSEIKGEKENSQDNIIHSAYVALGKPASVKMIQEYLRGIEINLDINVVSRSVNNLHSPKKGKAKIVFVGARSCGVTGRTVNFYESILKLGSQISIF